jgi:hypothetical protein
MGRQVVIHSENIPIFNVNGKVTVIGAPALAVLMYIRMCSNICT